MPWYFYNGEISRREVSASTALFYFSQFPGGIWDPFTKKLLQIEGAVVASVPGLFWAVPFLWPVAGTTGNRSKATLVQCSDPSWGGHWPRVTQPVLHRISGVLSQTSLWSTWLRGRMALDGSAGVTATASPPLSQRAFSSSLLRWSMVPTCLCSLPGAHLVWSKSCSSLWFRGFPVHRHAPRGWWASCRSSTCNLPVLESLQKWVTCGMEISWGHEMMPMSHRLWGVYWRTDVL